MKKLVLLAVLLAGAGCYPAKYTKRTVTKVDEAVLSVEPDADAGAAWVTTRSSTTTITLRVAEEVRRDGPTGNTSADVVGRKVEQVDSLWYCAKAAEGQQPSCVPVSVATPGK